MTKKSFALQGTEALFDDPFCSSDVDTLPEKSSSGRDTSKSNQAIEAVRSEIFAKDEKNRSVTLSYAMIFDTRSSGLVPLADRIIEIYSSELNEALRDLGEARDEAREEEFPQPSDIALKNAERLLREMYRISPRRFEVYPTPDGKIAIDAPDGHERSVILLCDSEGGALCLVNLNGTHRRARYSTTETLPDGFVHEALDDLER